MKIRPVGAELLLVDIQTDVHRDRHDEAKSLFSQYCERAYSLFKVLDLTVSKTQYKLDKNLRMLIRCAVCCTQNVDLQLFQCIQVI